MWITQQYDNGVHVIPDTEPGHILDTTCFCRPTIQQEGAGDPGRIITHRDAPQRAGHPPHEGNP